MQNLIKSECYINLVAMVHTERTQSLTYRLVEFMTTLGEQKRVLLPTTKLLNSGDTKKFFVEHDHPLVEDESYWKSSISRLKKDSSDFINAVSSPGHHSGYYLTSSGELVASEEDPQPVMLDSVNELHLPKEEVKGTLDEWKENVAVLAIHSNRLMLALCSAFSGLIIRFTNVENGGYHFYGDSSKGKSTCFHIPASVFGSQDFINSWASTATGLEETAAGHNDSLLLLNELALLDPDSKAGARKATNTTYKLTEGKSTRRTKSFQANGLSWRLVLISTGEHSMEQYAENGGMSRMAGERVRVVDVPADCEKGLGIFESLPEDCESPSELAEQLVINCESYHGTAKVAFLKAILKKERREPGALKDRMSRFMEEFIVYQDIDRTNGQQIRIARRFALAYAAGIIAVKTNIIPFSEDEVMESITACYVDTISSEHMGGKERDNLLMGEIVKAILNEKAVDLCALKSPMSRKRALKKKVFLKSINGTRIIAVRSSFFNDLAGNQRVARRFRKHLQEEGMLLASADRKATRSITISTKTSSVRDRFLCFYMDKLKEV